MEKSFVDCFIAGQMNASLAGTRYKDRDENGAKNIFKVGTDASPEIFSRKVSWRNSKRLVHYLKI